MVMVTLASTLETMKPLSNPDKLRLPLSLAAAALGIAICVSQHHVRVAISDPGSYTSPLHHRCGLVMLTSVAWALLEVTRGLRSTA